METPQITVNVTPQLATAEGTVDVPASSLTAAVVDVERRVIRGLALPWNVYGLTSAGRLKASRGSVELPADPGRVKLFVDHSALGIGAPGRTVVGHATALEDTPEGIVATFKIASGPNGDQALAEAGEDRTRDGLSVELVDLDLDGDTVTAGRLMGVALVPIPAFDDARATHVAASLSTTHTREETAMPPLELVADAAPEAPFTITYTPDDAPAASESEAAAAAPAVQASLTAAAAPQGLQATSSPSSAIPDLNTFYAALSQRHSGRMTRELEAALTDITNTAVGLDVDQPAWVGQLWDGVQYQRKIVPLLGGAKTLTSYTVNGWKWGTKPEVAAWAGDKTAVPSNAVTTDPFTTAASRLAGAHDIDRKFRDFNDTAFFQAYYEAMTESYARKSDAALMTAILAAATDEATPAYEGFLGAIAAGVQMIDDETGADSTFILVNKADLIPYVLETTNFDLPAFLETIGVSIDRVVSYSGVTAGHVVVGTSAAMDYYELPGSPIRVEAIDMVKGGVDAGVFGYYATVLHDAAGIVDVVIDPVGA